MKYDFDVMINRRNTNSLNVNEGELAMWVADMNFQTAPCVQKSDTRKSKII